MSTSKSERNIFTNKPRSTSPVKIAFVSFLAIMIVVAIGGYIYLSEMEYETRVSESEM